MKIIEDFEENRYIVYMRIFSAIGLNKEIKEHIYRATSPLCKKYP